MSDTISLNAARAEREDDNRHMTPADTLRDAISAIESGRLNPSSLMVISLDRSDGQFQSNWFASNLRSSEMIALMETVKSGLLRDMGYT